MVSVIVASYNHATFVTAAIESVLNQTFQDFEIIVTDDGSADGTPDHIRALRDSRISLVQFPRNYGACVALNSSIKRASGEYIAVLNSDDIFFPKKLELQVAFLKSHTNIGATFAYPQFIDDAGERVSDNDTFYRSIFRVENRAREQWLRHFFIYGNILCHPTALIRRRCYDRVGLYNPALAQLPDLEMWVRILRYFDIFLLAEPLIGFRILEKGMNASAPRPEVRVRLEWEWLKVLEQFSQLDSKTLIMVFPEFTVPQRRTIFPSWMVRWSERQLNRYLQGSTADVATPDSSRLRQRSVRWQLAEMALQVGKPAHISFALETMYKELIECEDETRYREFINLTGAFDASGVLTGAPANRYLGHAASLTR